MKTFFLSPPIIFFLLFVLFFSQSCKKSDAIPPKEFTSIKNQTFHQTLLIEGNQYDSLVIENCLFSEINGDGLQIKNVNNLIIRNCTFKNINGNAIRFRNSGTSNNVLIEGNKIFDIQKNGILAYETHSNTSIIGNTIYNVGLDNVSSTFGAPHHGIYFQGKNFIIHQNKIHDIINENGNCISVRSYGKISGNILYNATKYGVSYYSDHPGQNGHLLIENNFIYDNESRGVFLNTNGNPSNHIGHATVRFNSIVTQSKSCVGISANMENVTLEIFGNILVRTDGVPYYLDLASPATHFTNLEANGDIGFVNFTQRDLHINSTSIARNFVNGITDFPSYDIDDDLRNGSNLDVGADEIK